MVHHKKLKASVILASVAAVAFLAIMLYSTTDEKVKILYFRNDGCTLIKNTDSLIIDVESSFGDNVAIRKIDASLYTADPEDSQEIKELREQYGIVGLPEIVINGRKMTSEFNRNNLFSEICSNFRVKPLVCL